MCYSAQIEADYTRFLRVTGSTLSIRDFVRIYWARQQDTKLHLPRALDSWFASGADGDSDLARRYIKDFNDAQIEKLERDLFKQARRLADAQRSLQLKITKKAEEEKRISGDKLSKIKAQLAGLKRQSVRESDGRFFPGWYVPVVIVENGSRVVKPMRYQCRPEGKPAFYDTKYPGTYNARRDNLTRFWKGQFGHTHGVIVAKRFFENVDRDGKNVVLEFWPNSQDDMLIACLYSHWSGTDGDDLWSFAAVTDDPPPEISEAGHDRCIIPIKGANLDAWLNPSASDLNVQLAILDDRERPYYEHRLAA